MLLAKCDFCFDSQDVVTEICLLNVNLDIPTYLGIPMK